MDIKGLILATVSFLLVAVSCSVENDTIMNDIDNGVTQTSAGDVVLSANLTTQAKVTTKAGNYDNEIRNCIVFLLNANDKVIGLTSTETYTEEWIPSIMTKVQQGLYMVAVANVDIDDFKKCSTYSAIENEVLNHPEYLTKQGRVDVLFGNFEGSASAVDAPVFTVSDPILLKQVSARVELSSFQVNYVGEADATEKPVVLLTSVELVNTKTESYLFRESAGYNQNPISLFSGVMEPSADLDNIGMWVFQNQSSNATKMTLKFSVNGVENDSYSREYTINPEGKGASDHNQILAGNVYKLNVKVNVYREVPEFDVDLDWEVIDMEAIQVNIPDFE